MPPTTASAFFAAASEAGAFCARSVEPPRPSVTRTSEPIAWNARLRCTDEEATWETTVGEFLAANTCDTEVSAIVVALGPGETADLGGYCHCGGVWTVERVS